MNKIILTLAIVMGGWWAAPASAQENLSISVNRLNVGMPIPKMWSGLQMSALCAPDDPQGKKNAEQEDASKPEKKSKGKTPGWAKGIAGKADTLKILMDVVFKHKVSVKMKF